MIMNHEMIEKLKKNERPLGLLSEEEQKVLQEFAKTNNVELFTEKGWERANWRATCFGNTYRIPPDCESEPEPEVDACGVIRCEVTTKERGTVLYCVRNASLLRLHKALDDPDFIGYEYENGLIEALPRLFWSPWEPARHPKYVLFKNSQAAG